MVFLDQRQVGVCDLGAGELVPSTPSPRPFPRQALSETANTAERRRPNLKSQKSFTKARPCTSTSALLGE